MLEEWQIIIKTPSNTETFQKDIFYGTIQQRELNKTPLKKGVNMEKEMLAIAKIKSGEGKFEKFMGFMQSDEGMAVRKTIAHVEKTVPAIAPDKSYVMFKVSVHNEEEMKKFASGNNPIAKPIFDECIEIVQMYELSQVKL